MKKMIGLLGGTFDPIHFGHMRVALELYQQLNLHEIRFIPCQKPVLKAQAQATSEQRLAMLQLAIQDQAGFTIDDRELKRSTPSYTIDTLISLRQEFSDATLCLILGSDSVNDLAQWHRWQELIQYAHLIIILRPDHMLNVRGPVATLIQQTSITDPQELQQTPAGKTLIVTLAPLTISSTTIRQQIAQNLSPRYLLPEAVYTYIQQQNLYH